MGGGAAAATSQGAQSMDWASISNLHPTERNKQSSGVSSLSAVSPDMFVRQVANRRRQSKQLNVGPSVGRTSTSSSSSSPTVSGRRVTTIPPLELPKRAAETVLPTTHKVRRSSLHEEEVVGELAHKYHAERRQGKRASVWGLPLPPPRSPLEGVADLYVCDGPFSRFNTVEFSGCGDSTDRALQSCLQSTTPVTSQHRRHRT